MARLIRVSLTTAETDACNSLDGIEGYANEDACLVQQTNHWYRFFAASTLTPNGRTVIAPADITPPAAGRWILQGIGTVAGARAEMTEDAGKRISERYNGGPWTQWINTGFFVSDGRHAEVKATAVEWMKDGLSTLRLARGARGARSE